MPAGSTALDAIVETLSTFPQVVAIFVGGSRASEFDDATSDYDLYTFTTVPVPRERRRELALRFDTEPEIANQWWGESDYLTNGSNSYDLMFWDAGDFERMLRRVIEEHQPSNGYTTAFWYTARTMEPRFDRSGWLARIGDLAATPYPDALADAIIAHNHPILRGIHTSYAAQVRRAIELDDPVSVNHRFAELVKTAFDIVFAHHRQLHPGEKRQLRVLATLPGTAGHDAAIRALLVAAGDPAFRDLKKRVDAVCDEVDAILWASPHYDPARSTNL
jgi:hypothetical protein